MHRRTALLIFWLLTDASLFVGAYVLAYFLRVGWILSSDFPFDRFLSATLLTLPLWLGALAATRMFSLTRRQASWKGALYIVSSSIIGVATFTLLYYFNFTAFFSRLLLILAFLFTSAFTFAWHMIFEHLQRLLLRRDPATFPTLIIGVTRESTALIRLLNRTRNPLKPVAILDASGAKEKEIDGVPVLGKLNKLEDTLRRFHITHLIHCSDLEHSVNFLSLCRAQGITYLLLPSVLGIIGGDERVETLEGKPVTVVRPEGGWLSWFFQ